MFFSQKVAYSCSAEGTVMAWDVSTLQVGLISTISHLFAFLFQLVWLFLFLQVKKHFRLSCSRLQSIYSCSGTLWCCKFPSHWTVGKMENLRLWWCKVNTLSFRLSLWSGLRLQRQDNGGVEEWFIKTLHEFTRTTKRLHNYFQLCSDLTRGTNTHFALNIVFL